MDDQIIQQSASYRRGLVLGLTMAEIMILLIFCLLIAMTTFLSNERLAREAAEKSLEKEKAAATADHQMVENLKRDPRLTELLKGALGSDDAAAVDEFWRDLVESRGLASAARDAGLTMDDLKERGKDLKTLVTNGINSDRALRDAGIAASAEKALAGAAPFTPDEIGKAIRLGLAGQKSGDHRWPPIITLNDTNGQFFKSGSAELNPDFRKTIVEKEPEILKLMKEFDVDVIEVVGHTDERPVSALGLKQSNLDRDLLPALKNESAIGDLVPGDNAGLGLARAVSVASVLRQNKELSVYKILPLSGGQLIDTDETLAIAGTGGDVPERRRIEIRLRKANPATAKSSQVSVSPKIPVPIPKPKVSPVQADAGPLPPSSTRPAAMPLDITQGH